MVFSCDSLISIGNETNTKPFFTAKEKLAGLKVYEENHSEVLLHKVCDSLNKNLEHKMKNAANQWTKAAKAQEAVGEYVKAMEFYQLSLALYETPETKKLYEGLLNEEMKESN